MKMKGELKRLVRFFVRLLSRALNFKIIFSVFNYIYERLPYIVAKNIARSLYLPDRDSEWKIKLVNGKLVKTKIYKADQKTKHFALAYKYHNYAMNMTEKLLNDYYGLDTPWIDVGSNLGLRSLLALSYGRKVYFIEPNEEVNKLNLERCRLNNFTNFELHKTGISNKTNVVDFYIDKTSYRSSVDGVEDLDRVVSIMVTRLDCLFDSDKYKNACIKIDVEGHELEVIEGAANFINQSNPTMIIEVNSNRVKFLSVMHDLGYDVYEIFRFTRNKFLKRVNGHIKSNDFLCVKEENLKKLINGKSL